MVSGILRNLFKTPEAEDAAAPAPARTSAPAAAVGEPAPQAPSAPPSPPQAPAAARCLVVGASERDLAQISAAMGDAHIAVVAIAPESLGNAVGKIAPQAILMSLGEGKEDMVRVALMALTMARYKGVVQLIGPVDRTEALVILASGEGLHMAVSLISPVSRHAVAETIRAEGLARTASGSVSVDLGVALRKRWIEFWYQPKIQLSTKRMIGAESLARLRHPTHGPLLPSAFLPNATISDIAQLGIEALRASFRDWLVFDRAKVNLRLAVNIPAAAIDADQIIRMIDGQQLAQSWPGLVVDIEETDIRDIKTETRDLIMRLKGRGIDIAADNVGLDPRAFASLVTLPLSEIKLARNLVHGVAEQQTHRSVCQMLIDFAHQRGIKAVANGIEAAADLEVLRTLGCDIAQGQVFSPALPRDQFIELLIKHASRIG